MNQNTITYNIHDDKILLAIVRQIVATADPDKIILFGSRAIGKEVADSDYDVCVLKKNLKKRRKLAQKIYLNLDIMASVDVIVNTPKRYLEIKQNPFLIYHYIEKYGKVVYEKQEVN